MARGTCTGTPGDRPVRVRLALPGALARGHGGTAGTTHTTAIREASHA